MTLFTNKRGAWPFARQCCLIASLPLIFLAGCSEKKRQQIAAAVQQQASNIAESATDAASNFASQATATVEDALPATGQVTLKTSPAFEAESATMQLISIGDGRDNIVQITTYEPGQESLTYPSLLIRGTTTVGDAASLSGESIECQLYMQASSSEPIAATPPGRSISVSFRAYDPEKKTLTASISSGSLVDSNNASVRVGGGNLVAVVKGS